MTKPLKWIVGAAMIAAMAMQSAAAAPVSRCWENRHLTAARISELHTMLMAVTLRCQAAGIDIGPGYEGFLKRQKAGLADAEKRVREHFGESGKLHAGAYDQYLTSIGNFYGSGRTDEATCRSFEAVQLALGREGASRELLVEIAGQVVRSPRLDAAVCTQTAQAE